MIIERLAPFRHGLVRAFTIDIGATILLILSFLLVAPTLFGVIRSVGDPLSGEHYHRQADTFSVAVNFLEHPNFFYPRVHHDSGTTGIRGMEAPIYPYLISLSMRVFGESDWVGRLVCALFFLVAFGALMTLRTPVDDAPRSSSLIVIAVASPMTLYYARQIQPDMPMVALGVLGVVLALRSHDQPWWKMLIASLVFGLGMLTKYPLIFVWPALVAASNRWRWSEWRTILIRCALTLIPLAMLVAWIKWSAGLDAAYAKGDLYFASTPKSSEIIKNLKSINVAHSIGWILPYYAIAFPAFAVVISGFVISFRAPYRRYAAPFWIWLLGAFGIAIVFWPRFGSHNYYGILYLPCVWYFGALGVQRIRDWLASMALAPEAPIIAGMWLVSALLAQPYAEWGALHVAVLGGTALLLTVVTLVPRTLDPRSTHVRKVVLGLAALAALSITVDMSQARFVERRTRVGQPQQFAAWAKEIRDLVTPRTQKSDRVVLIARGSPWLFLAAKRRGWLMTAAQFNAKPLSTFTTRNGKWLLVAKHSRWFAGRPRWVYKQKAVAETPNWQLFSLTAAPPKP